MLRTLKRNLRSTVAGLLNRLKSVTFETAVRFNLLQLRFFSFASGAPLGFTDEQVFVDDSHLKSLIWTASLGIVWLRAAFMAGAVTLSLTVDRFSNPFYLPMYLGLFSSTLNSAFIGYSVLNSEPGCFATMWNFILKHKSTVKSQKTFLWFMCILALSVNLSCLSNSRLLALNPKLAIQFRFGVNLALEEGFLTLGPIYYALVVISIVADFWSFLVSASFICFVAISQMLCLEAWTSVMNQLLVSCKERIATIEGELAWRRVEELVLLIRVFNTCNSGAIFYIKLLCLSFSISCSSALLILDFQDHSVFLVMLVYLSTITSFGFPALYHSAHGVSAGLQSAKRELLKFRQLERRLWSVSPRGIQIGSFRTYERESNLIYWDFIVNQVISIALV